MKRTLLTAVVLTGAPAFLFGVGARIQNTRLGPDATTATVTVVNDSDKYISAIALVVDASNQDGTTYHAVHSKDLLPLLASQMHEGHTINDAAIHPGATYDFQLAFSQPITKVDVRLGGVLYTDNTGDAADEAAYKGMLATREMQAKTLREAVNLLSSADSVADAESFINHALYSGEASPNSALGSELSRLLHNLHVDLSRGGSEKDVLAANLAELRQEAQVIAAHAAIRRVP